MKKIYFSVIGIVASMLVIFNVHAEGVLSAEEIMQRYDSQSRAYTEEVQLTMNLINKEGKIRVRQLISVSKTNGEGQQNSLLRFVEPADVRGTALLTHEHVSADDDRWLYLPALRKTRRVAATDDRDNFMGSDFAYEDIDFEDLDAFQYKSVGTETVDGSPCYVIEATPKSNKKAGESGYSKRKLWIRKDNFFMVAADYYNKRGELLKQRKAYDVKPVSGTDKWRPARQEMVNLKTGHKTELQYSDFSIGAEVSDDVFSLRELTRGI